MTMNKQTLSDRLASAIARLMLITTLALLDAFFIDVLWGVTVGKHMSCVVFKVALFVCLCAYGMAESIKIIVKN